MSIAAWTVKDTFHSKTMWQIKVKQYELKHFIISNMHAKQLVTPPLRWSEKEAFWRRLKGKCLLHVLNCAFVTLYNSGITRRKEIQIVRSHLVLLTSEMYVKYMALNTRIIFKTVQSEGLHVIWGVESVHLHFILLRRIYLLKRAHRHTIKTTSRTLRSSTERK